MKEKNRIVIPTGHEPEEGLETPHFDAEETLLSARPVVPLTEEAREAAQSAHADWGAKPPTRRIPILALIIIAAVSVGLASGLAIGLYQGRQKTAAPVTAQTSTATTTADTQFKQKPAEETTKPQQQLPPVQTVADTEQQTTLSEPAGEPVVEESPQTPARTEASDKPQTERRAAPDKKSEDEKQSPPPAPERRRPQNVRPDDDGSKKQKLPLRRRPPVEQEPEDIPRTVERATRDLNRIREIFEGPRP
jgi:multidrug efflux pump subunit AcrB